jgi:hypothetical protein
MAMSASPLTRTALLRAKVLNLPVYLPVAASTSPMLICEASQNVEQRPKNESPTQCPHLNRAVLLGSDQAVGPRAAEAQG